MINHHAIEALHGRPPPLPESVMGTEIILARQRNYLFVVAGLDHFVQRKLVLHTAEPGATAMDNFLPHRPGSGDVPESHPGVEITARPTLAGDVAAGAVFRATGKNSSAKKLRQFRQRLHAEHIGI